MSERGAFALAGCRSGGIDALPYRRGSGTVAPTGGQGRRGASTKLQRPSIKGFEGMGPAARPGWRVSVKGALRLGLQGFTTTCSPLTRVGTANRLPFDGMGFIKVSEA
jgi:hypothetical protein